MEHGIVERPLPPVASMNFALFIECPSCGSLSIPSNRVTLTDQKSQSTVTYLAPSSTPFDAEPCGNTLREALLGTSQAVAIDTTPQMSVELNKLEVDLPILDWGTSDHESSRLAELCPFTKHEPHMLGTFFCLKLIQYLKNQ
jgi:hypothetical protein